MRYSQCAGAGRGWLGCRGVRTRNSAGVQGPPAFLMRDLEGHSQSPDLYHGKVLLLDFWATWCGPCVQTMPLVDGVVREFADRGVELLAVNLEEHPEQVRATLERHKLKVPVALDRDGVVAAKYAVTAIPQTVVIDRDGRVARVFVGGGRKAADALRNTAVAGLRVLTSGPIPPNPAELLNSGPMTALIGELRGMADVTILPRTTVFGVS